MTSWDDADEGDNWVTYGSAFSDDDTEEGRQRALHFGKHRPVPTAYEQRVLNERGRPMRFHGAFTGGFSAGYFNTVGSKEGFKPCTFHSSRKDRNRETEERKMVQRPEDFMDDEDFGEFGIAPRRVKMAHTFDDTHVRDSLKAALGGQSVIPISSEIIKNLIVPSKGPLAERLLRRMGWRDPTTSIELDEIATGPESDRLSNVRGDGVGESTGILESVQSPAPCMFAKISFEAKTNTFGLGYSGLNPDVAMGRQLPQSRSIAPWDQPADRHPEESSTALARRQQAVQLQPGFNPRGGASRSGIRGQAFGVGALETEDGDVYAQDRLADYDWEIGAEASSAEDEEDEEDAEQAELEAARRGCLSSASKQSRSSGLGKPNSKQPRTMDGWTAPTIHNSKRSSSSKLSATDVLCGFVPASNSQDLNRLTLASTPVRLPPGYMPVFNPLCVRDPTQQSKPPDDEGKSSHTEDRSATRDALSFSRSRLDAQSRAQLLNDPATESVLDMISPVEQLRLKAAAAGLPVPQKAVQEDSPTSNTAHTCATDLTQSLKTDGLLKPFKTDPAKQARFEAFQVLVRRGFTDEVAYTRCSGGVDLSGEDRERELNAFLAIIRAARSANTSNSGSKLPHSTPSDDTHSSQARGSPLSAQLPAHKQQLVASLLASRFRSAGCMDISKELSEAEEKAQRAKVENAEIVEPRDRAVATESYGAMTRRRLEWHPDRILCKRINVPHPYPESTFVGCPEERRLRQPWRRGLGKHKNRWDDKGSGEFSLFDLLDVNRGREPDAEVADNQEDISDDDDDDNEDDNEGSVLFADAQLNRSDQAKSTTTEGDKATGSTYNTPRSTPTTVPRGASLFSVLFDAAATASQLSESNTSITDETSVSKSNSVSQSVKSEVTTEASKPSSPRLLGPTLPDSQETMGLFSDDVDEQRPPMDLFKSIFASDEELSESETEQSMDKEVADEPSSIGHDQPGESGSMGLSDSGRSSALFAHLFEPVGDMDTPLSALSRFTSGASTNTPCNSKQKPSVEHNPEFVHGPSLPPSFESRFVNERLPSQGASIVDLTQSDDRTEWVVGCAKSSDRKRHKRSKHSSSSKSAKHKSKRKHKSDRSHRKSHKRSRHAGHSSRRTSRARSGSGSHSTSASDSSADSDSS